MNREILFRGKRIDGKGWVYGYYVYRPDGKHLIYGKPFDEVSQNTYHEVISETVGQFTGLLDNNGTKIFEWDIVKWWSGSHSIDGLPDNVKKQADETFREWLKSRIGNYDYASNGWYKMMNEGIVIFFGASFCIHNEVDITNHIKDSRYNKTLYYGSLKISEQYEITSNIYDNTTT